MPKRSRSDEDSDYLRKKIRKIEKKLKKHKERSRKSARRIIHTSSSSEVEPLSPLIEDTEIQPELDIMPITGEEIEAGPSPLISQEAVTAPINPFQAELSTEASTVLPELDTELLNLLGDTPSKNKKYGPDIQHDLAVRLEHVATTGLSKELRKELIEKHIIPKNCMKIDAPKLNPEIKAALSEMLIKKDKALELKQAQLAAAISCVADALTQLFSSENRDPTVIKLLIEASRILCDSQHKESLTRRSFICSTIKKDIKDQLYNTEIDSFLFGETLADTLKAAKAITKSGNEIKINASMKKNTFIPKPKQIQNQSLNQRPPLPMTTRRTGAARRLEVAPAAVPAPAPRPRPQQQPRQFPRSQQHHAQRR